MICTVCGSACPEGAEFCPECGAALPVPESPLPEEPATTPVTAEALLITDTPVQTIVECPAAEAPESLPEAAPLPREEAPAEEPAAQDPAAAPVCQSSPYQHSPYQFSPYQNSPYQSSPYQVRVPRGPAKKGTHWIPIAIMAVLCVFGLALFLALPYDTADAPMISDSDTPWFYNDNGTLNFYEEYYHGPEELTVPDMVNGQPVTALAPYCFAGCDFTTVILPDTLERIGNNAFDGCTSMRGIFLPEGLTSIGAEAFYCCFELEAICIPSTTKVIETDAFYGCLKLQHIFYNGIHSHWLDLYEDMIGARTQVYCTDGTFGQHYNNR